MPEVVLATAGDRPPGADGPLTPGRLQHLADQFARMRRAGIKVPVTWGPPTDAVGEDREIHATSWNAGYVTHLRTSADGRRLHAQLDVPGAEMDREHARLLSTARHRGREVQLPIREIRSRIAGRFRDGRGVEWRDVLTGLFLIPSELEGVQSLSCRPTVCTISLSTRPLVSVPAMPAADEDLDELPPQGTGLSHDVLRRMRKLCDRLERKALAHLPPDTRREVLRRQREYRQAPLAHRLAGIHPPPHALAKEQMSLADIIREHHRREHQPVPMNM